MTIAAAAVGTAAVATGAQIKTAVENADKINKISQSTGTTVEKFSKLNHAAQLAHVSQEAFGKSLDKLSKAMIRRRRNRSKHGIFAELQDLTVFGNVMGLSFSSASKSTVAFQY